MTNVIKQIGGIRFVEYEPKFKARVVLPDGTTYERELHKKFTHAIVWQTIDKRWVAVNVYENLKAARQSLDRNWAKKSKRYQQQIEDGTLLIVRVSNRAIKKASN